MWGKSVQVFKKRVVLYLYRVATLYDELDTVLLKFFEDGESFQSVAADAVEVGHQDSVYLVVLDQAPQFILARPLEIKTTGCFADDVCKIQVQLRRKSLQDLDLPG